LHLAAIWPVFDGGASAKTRLHDANPGRMEFFGKDSWSSSSSRHGENFCSLSTFFELDLLKQQIGHQSPQP
jgi:hypothetical protein